MNWKEEPIKYQLGSNTICMTSGQGTNLFNSSSSNRREHTFQYWYKDFIGDFVVKCKVSS